MLRVMVRVKTTNMVRAMIRVMIKIMVRDQSHGVGVKIRVMRLGSCSGPNSESWSVARS